MTSASWFELIIALGLCVAGGYLCKVHIGSSVERALTQLCDPDCDRQERALAHRRPETDAKPIRSKLE